MANFFCEICQKQAQFMTIPRVTRELDVSKSALYSWMDRGWVHWRRLPNNRRMICAESLSRADRPAEYAPMTQDPFQNRPKPSRTDQ